MAEIVVTISKKNPTEVHTEVVGMRGKGCASLLDAFQQAAQLRTKSTEIKPEFHQTVPQKLPQRRG
jgi:hypothetical protein